MARSFSFRRPQPMPLVGWMIVLDLVKQRLLSDRVRLLLALARPAWS